MAFLLSGPSMLAQQATMGPEAPGRRKPPAVHVELDGIDPTGLADTVGRMLGSDTHPDGEAAVLVSPASASNWIQVSTVVADSGRRRARSSVLPPGSWNALAPVAAGMLAAELTDTTVVATDSEPVPPDAPPLAASMSRTVADALGAAIDGVVMVIKGSVIRRGPAFETTPATAVAVARPLSLPPGAVVADIRGLLDGRLALTDAAGAVWVGDHRAGDPQERLRRLPLSATPRPTARVLVGASGTVAAVSPDTITFLYPRHAELRFPLTALRSGAAEIDRNGYLWILDVAERRVRVLAVDVLGDVREVHSMTPRLPDSELAAMQTLAITADGGVLLGSQHSVIGLDDRGRERWRMRHLPTRPRRRLPAAFTLHASLGDAQAFYLHDLTTGEGHLLSRTAADHRLPDATALARAAVTSAERYQTLLLPQMALELFSLARRELESVRATDPLDGSAATLFTDVDAAQRALRSQLDGTIATRLAVEEVRYYPALELWYAQPGATRPVQLRELRSVALKANEQISVGFGGTPAARLVVSEPFSHNRQLTVAPTPPRRAATTVITRYGQATIVMERVGLWDQAATRHVASVPAEVQPWFELPALAASDTEGNVDTTRLGALRWLVRPNAVALNRWQSSASPLALLEALTAAAEVVADPHSASPLQSVDRTLATRTGSRLDWVAALASAAVRLGLEARVWWDSEPILVVFGQPGWLSVVSVPGVLPPRGPQARSLSAGAPPAAVLAILPMSGAQTTGPTLPKWMQQGARRVSEALSRGEQSWQIVPLASAAELGATLAQPRPLVPLNPLLPAASSERR